MVGGSTKVVGGVGGDKGSTFVKMVGASIVVGGGGK